MSVFLRTGRDSAVSFSWPIYLLVVLPLQVLVAFWKGMLWLVLMLGAGVVWLSRTAHRQWRAHRGTTKAGPPAA